MVSKVVGALTLVGLIGAGIWGIDARYARIRQLEQVAARLDQKILRDRKYSIQDRLWKLRDQYGQNCELGSKDLKATCRDLERQLGETNKDLERLKK